MHDPNVYAKKKKEKKAALRISLIIWVTLGMIIIFSKLLTGELKIKNLKY